MKRHFKAAMCMLISACMLLSAASCGKADTGGASSHTSKASSKTASSKEASSTDRTDSDSSVMDTDSSSDESKPSEDVTHVPVKDIWINVPMVSKALLDKGISGGEGCEMILGLCVDDIDGQLGFFGTDVEGTYRTEDGGKNWMLVGVGMKCAGACGFAIDPTNKDRVLCVGANSSALKYNGVYLSTDRGESWKYVCEATTYNYRDQHTQIAYDKSSYDKKLGYCTVAYWSREDNAAKNANNNAPGLYKTTDGGSTWKLLSGTSQLGSGDVAVNPSNGTVYVGNKNGVFVSTDGGKSFKKTLSATVLSLDAVLTRPGTVWCTTDNELCISTDSGKTWSRSHPTGFPQKCAAHLRVSPANPNNMIAQYDEATYDGGSPNKNVIRISHDGGKSWAGVTLHFDGWWVPPHANGISRFVWSPVDENKVISNISQCQICVSTNAGRDFYWSNAGNSGFCATSLFRFNVNHSNLVAVASQDYNAGHSTDSGNTWTYVNWSGKGWGGMTYGCYMMSANDVVCGVSTEWYSKTHEVEICVTHDGGKTIVRTGINTSNTPIGMGALGNDSIAFFADYRTTDMGKTWKKMNGCTAVFEVDRKTGRLWGANGSTAVFSDDNGATWKTYGNLSGKITDMAYDSINKYLYAADSSGKTLYRSTVSGATGKFTGITVTGSQTNIKCVAVDQKTGTVYAGESGGSTDHSLRRVYRSTDLCKTWKCLTRTSASDRTGTPYGPRSINSLTVNPDNGEMFVAGGCTGVWKIKAP